MTNWATPTAHTPESDTSEDDEFRTPVASPGPSRDNSLGPGPPDKEVDQIADQLAKFGAGDPPDPKLSPGYRQWLAKQQEEAWERECEAYLESLEKTLSISTRLRSAKAVPDRLWKFLDRKKAKEKAAAKALKQKGDPPK